MVERSFSAFPKFLSEGISNLVSPGSQSKGSSTGVGKYFETFIQTVNRYGSNVEEDEIIQKELSLLQQRISSSDATKVQVRDYLCCAIYCRILGYNVSFAGIHAVKLAQQGSLLEKRIGYLTASLLLHPGHELVLLLVNTIQKDLKSSNILDNCMALTAASQMIGAEIIPALLPMVLEKLKHNRELVRQKAVLCLHRFQLLAPDLLAHVQSDLEQMLFDKDPGVMAAALNIVSHNIQQAPGKCLHLVDMLISILHQVLTRKMSAMFEFHSVPFPWLQIKILRCLSNMAAEDEQTALKLSPLLTEVLQRASAKESIAYAVIYECLMCVSSIKPNKQLMEEASRHVGRFIRSTDSNLRYVGVKALIGLVKVDPYFVMDYQGLIVDSLEQADQTIQRKMYKLLYQIANPSNVEVITEKLLHQLDISLDKYWRSEVISMVMELSKSFEPSVTWPYNTKFRCLQFGRNDVSSTQVQSVVSDLLTVITTDNLEVKQFLVKKCIECLMADKIHHNVIQVSGWALAELSPLLTKLPEDRVLSLYTKHLCNPDLPDHVKASLITGLQKIACGHVISNETMATGISQVLKVKQSAIMKQRLTILYQLCKLGTRVRLCREPEELDFTLSFLDSYISQCIEQGASPYKPRHLRLGNKTAQPPQLSIVEKVGLQSEASGGTAFSSSQYKSGSSTSSGIIKDESEAKLDLSGVKKVWGKQGIIKKSEQPHSQDPSVPDKGSEKQQMAAALFGGLQPSHKLEDSDGATHNTGLFGASDQDFTTLLPTGDTAGWRNTHKIQSEKLEDGASKLDEQSDESLHRGATKTKDTTLENFNFQIDKESIELEHKDIHIGESEIMHNLDIIDKTNIDIEKTMDGTSVDTGYDSNIQYAKGASNLNSASGYVEAMGGLEISPIAKETESRMNNVACAVSITATSSSTQFRGNEAMGSLEISPIAKETVGRKENAACDFSNTASYSPIFKGSVEEAENISNLVLDNETLSNKNITHGSKEQLAQNDLDEALTLLLNDSSNFVNISVVTNNEDSMADSDDNVKVRESIYSLNDDNMGLGDLDKQKTDFVSAEAKDFKDLDRNVSDSGGTEAKQSMYDLREPSGEMKIGLKDTDNVKESIYDEDL